MKIISGTLTLLQVMKEVQCKKYHLLVHQQLFIGDPHSSILKDFPLSVYKIHMVEQNLLKKSFRIFTKADSWNIVLLRYFKSNWGS